MENEDELPLFPVSGWEIATIPAYGAIFIRPAFLAHAMQRPEEADPGRRYALLPAQARELITAIEKALQQLESAGPQTPPGSQH